MQLLPEITGLWGYGGPRKRHCQPHEPPHLVSSKAVAAGRVGSRRKVHKLFWQWLVCNRHRFLIDLKVEQREDRWIDFSFVGINPALTACFLGRQQEIEIWVTLDGERVDNIFSAYAWPKRVADGYIDVSLLEEYRVLRPSREEIWTLGIYEDFLAWVNEDLAPARWIEISGERDRWSSAKLSKSEQAPPPNDGGETSEGMFHIVLPCRV